MAIRHHILLSILPSLVAVRFGLSQQLIWVIGFLPIAFGWEGEGGGKQFAARVNERTRGALPGFTLDL